LLILPARRQYWDDWVNPENTEWLPNTARRKIAPLENAVKALLLKHRL
jgi:hypothetical protein